MAHLWDRRSRRVEYHTAIRIAPIGESVVSLGQTVNLSDSGVFIKTYEPHGVGASLLCDLALPDRTLALEGKVVWVAPDLEYAGGSFEQSESEKLKGEAAPAGMGIAFTDLSMLDTHALRRIVGTEEEVRLMDVFFEGVSQPVRVEALPVGKYLRMRTSLPFLKNRSSVDFVDRVDPSGKRKIRRAKISEVGLVSQSGTNANLPCLEIVLECDSSPTEAPLPSVPDLPETGPNRESFDPYEPSPRKEKQEVALGTLLPPVERLAAVEAAADGIPLTHYPVKDESALGAELSGKSVPLADETPFSALPLGIGRPDPLLPIESGETDFWSLKRGIKSRIWLWLAASLMTTIAIASFVQSGLWQRATDWIRKSPRSSVVLSSTQGVQRPEKLDELPEVGANRTKASFAAATTADQVETKRAPEQPEEILVRAPQVTKAGKFASVLIPISGSLAGSRTYRLSRPDGVVVMLPEAIPRLPFKDYELDQDGFRLIWVRKRGTGTHLRVLFAGGRWKHRVFLSSESVRVEVEPQVAEHHGGNQLN